MVFALSIETDLIFSLSAANKFKSQVRGKTTSAFCVNKGAGRFGNQIFMSQLPPLSTNTLDNWLGLGLIGVFV